MTQLLFDRYPLVDDILSRLPGTAQELRCSQAYIFKFLKANGLKLYVVSESGPL